MYTVCPCTDGTVVAADENGRGQHNVAGWRNVAAISVGSAHTVGLCGNGNVLVTGGNRWGSRGAENYM